MLYSIKPDIYTELLLDGTTLELRVYGEPSHVEKVVIASSLQPLMSMRMSPRYQSRVMRYIFDFFRNIAPLCEDMDEAHRAWSAYKAAQKRGMQINPALILNQQSFTSSRPHCSC